MKMLNKGPVARHAFSTAILNWACPGSEQEQSGQITSEINRADRLAGEMPGQVCLIIREALNFVGGEGVSL